MSEKPKIENVGKAAKTVKDKSSEASKSLQDTAKQKLDELSKYKIPDEYIEMSKKFAKKTMEMGQAAITTTMQHAKTLMGRLKK